MFLHPYIPLQNKLFLLKNMWNNDNLTSVYYCCSTFFSSVYFTVFNANFLCVCVSSTKYTSPDAPLPKFDFFSNV
jgi:hypothetical protein